MYVDIFTKWVADELQKRGHELFKTKPNNRLPRYKVFVFPNTPEFEKDLLDITLKR
ncbi:hypothetical protein [Peribacillus sp. NPDC060253]|uniref:hypothetical protein n=1 Tax=Peribacillus sp. NPDC060253 TaxID=3347084 RepID=UPI003668F24E